MPILLLGKLRLRLAQIPEPGLKLVLTKAGSFLENRKVSNKGDFTIINNRS